MSLIGNIFFPQVIMKSKFKKIAPRASREASTHKVLAGEHFQQGDEIVAIA